MPELLTYPWDSKYPDGNRNDFFASTAASPNIPTDAVVTNGFGNVTDGGYNWQQGSLKGSGSASMVYQRSYANNNNAQGFSYEADSSAGINYPGWFDVGAGGGRSGGEVLLDTDKSSYMKNVTACWFVSSNNKASNNATAGCRYQIRQVAIRYINANNKRLTLMTCPNKLAGLSYNTDAYGGNAPNVNGYELSSANKGIVKLDGLLFVGFRIAIFLGKASSPLSQKTQVAISAVTPGFENSSKAYNKDNKRIICRNSQTTYTQYKNESKFPIECR